MIRRSWERAERLGVTMTVLAFVLVPSDGKLLHSFPSTCSFCLVVSLHVHVMLCYNNTIPYLIYIYIHTTVYIYIYIYMYIFTHSFMHVLESEKRGHFFLIQTFSLPYVITSSSILKSKGCLFFSFIFYFLFYFVVLWSI